MKKAFLPLITGVFLLLVGVVVYYQPPNALAQESTPGGLKRVQEKVEAVKEKVEVRKENKVQRAQNAALSRVKELGRAVTRAEGLLKRIQIRIDKAKAAGKDTTEMESLMADARVKLAAAKTKLSTAEGKIKDADTKAEFADLHQSFKSIKDDLHTVRKDASSIIRLLKGFNSATSQGQNPQKEGTTPGKKK